LHPGVLGTLAQVHLGLFKAQNEFFRSLLVYWQPAGASFQIPIFPAAISSARCCSSTCWRRTCVIISRASGKSASR